MPGLWKKKGGGSAEFVPFKLRGFLICGYALVVKTPGLPRYPNLRRTAEPRGLCATTSFRTFAAISHHAHFVQSEVRGG